MFTFQTHDETTPKNWIFEKNFKRRYKQTITDIPKDEGLKVVTKEGSEYFFRLADDSTVSYEITTIPGVVIVEGNVFAKPKNL